MRQAEEHVLSLYFAIKGKQKNSIKVNFININTSTSVFYHTLAISFNSYRKIRKRKHILGCSFKEWDRLLNCYAALVN